MAVGVEKGQSFCESRPPSSSAGMTAVPVLPWGWGVGPADLGLVLFKVVNPGGGDSAFCRALVATDKKKHWDTEGVESGDSVPAGPRRARQAPQLRCQCQPFLGDMEGPGNSGALATPFT